MLGIKSVGELSRTLNLTPRRLFELVERRDDFIQVYELTNPANPGKKHRTVRCPTGPLRNIQTTLLRQVFRPRLWPMRNSFGGVPGRNAVQNAYRHASSRFVYTTDIADFFPSISFFVIRKMFASKLDCADDVAHVLARLCTHDGHLAQGLITSPILADRAVRRIDARVAGLAQQHGLAYTRFVDDLTLSGPFDLTHTESGIVALVRKIIADSDFTVAEHKEDSGRITDGKVAITGLRFVNGHLDPVASYVTRLEAALDAHISLGNGGPFEAVLASEAQLRGRVDYVCSINPNRRRSLRSRFSAVNWRGVIEHAGSRGLILLRKQLRPVERAQSESTEAGRRCVKN